LSSLFRKNTKKCTSPNDPILQVVSSAAFKRIILLRILCQSRLFPFYLLIVKHTIREIF